MLLATRFCTATVVNKQPSTIIKGLFVSWIIIFGAPKRILTDDGGEFNNAVKHGGHYVKVH